MPTEFHHRRRVEFSDTDMAGIMHFANYLRFMESAEHAFLRSLGVSPHAASDGATLGWPRVNVSCEFKRPLRFEDEVDLHLTVAALRDKSIDYLFSMRRCQADGTPGDEVAVGRMTTVCVRFVPGEPLKAVSIPEALASRLR